MCVLLANGQMKCGITILHGRLFTNTKTKNKTKKPHQSIDIYTTMWINLKTYEVEEATYKKLYVI